MALGSSKVLKDAGYLCFLASVNEGRNVEDL